MSQSKAVGILHSSFLALVRLSGDFNRKSLVKWHHYGAGVKKRQATRESAGQKLHRNGTKRCKSETWRHFGLTKRFGDDDVVVKISNWEWRWDWLVFPRQGLSYLTCRGQF